MQVEGSQPTSMTSHKYPFLPAESLFLDFHVGQREEAEKRGQANKIHLVGT